MSEINRALGAAGAPYPLAAGGKTYRLAPLTKGLQAAFEAWLKARARAEVYAMKPDLSPEEYVAALAKVARDGAAGAYDFTGAAAAGAIQTLGGLTHLLWLMLQRHQPELTEGDALALITDHAAECVAAIADMIGDVKKKRAPTATAAASP